MAKPDQPRSTRTARPITFEHLKPRSGKGAVLQLTAAGLSAQVSVLAEDLFRLRIVRGSDLSEKGSWAVARVPQAETPTRAIRTSRTAAIETKRGRFTVDLRDGSWSLRDHLGLELFSAGGHATCFAGATAQVTLSLQEGESIFGLGETSGTFNKRGLIREFWNIDVGGHASAVHANLRNMYVSIPFAVSLRHGRAAGLFWDNPGRQIWDIGQTRFDRWKLEATTGQVDLFFFLGPTCAEIVERYTELTGRMPLPPLWALGYQQCRYSYETRARLEEVARTFRRKQIPCDVLYLDIHYMDGYRVFTFGKRFPQPRAMLAGLARRGFKAVTIVDPGVKDDSKFPVLVRGKERRAFVKADDGHADYRGEVWPGVVRFPDFLNARTRAWWGEEQTQFQKLGVAGFWNDMNEPADFSAPGKDFPGECVHHSDFGPQRHASVHNVYGSQMARASFEGALRAAPDQRPFIITRAGYAGLQRHALVWTGDNDSSWEHLADSVQMLLNLSVSGVAFCGADVGGFHHNTTGELLARWTQLGAFTPFFRNHSNIRTIDQEPWAFGPRVEGICRKYIELRYQLLPYLYGLFVQAHRHGTPIMRPLFWHYQNDPIATATSDQFLLGPDLLIAPILRQGATARSVYLPTGTWFDFWTGEALRGGRQVLAEADLETLPIYVRAGALLPVIPAQQFVGQRKIDLVSLHLWPGAAGELDWYEDDGASLGYERGAVHQRRISVSVHRRTTQLQFGAAEGSFASQVKKWRIILRQTPRAVRPRLGSTPIPVGYQRQLSFCAFDVDNRPEAFRLTWR